MTSTDELEGVFREHRARLLGVIRRDVRDAQAAEDVLQEVFVKALAALARGARPGHYAAWLHGITRNAIVDHVRARRPTTELREEETADPSGEVDEEAAVKELAACLAPMIERLPGPYRDAVVGSELQGRTVAELARVEGVSESAVKSRLARGRGKLKAMIVACCEVEVTPAGRLAGFTQKVRTLKRC